MTTEECIIELYKQGKNFSEIGDRMYAKKLVDSEIAGMSLAFSVIKQALKNGNITKINEVEND